MKKMMRNLLTFALVFAIAAGFGFFFNADKASAAVKELSVTEQMAEKAIKKYNKKLSVEINDKKQKFKLKKSAISADNISVEEPEVKGKKATVSASVVYTQKIGKKEYELQSEFKLTYKYKGKKWKLSSVKAVSTEASESYEDDDDDWDDEDDDEDDWY